MSKSDEEPSRISEADRALQLAAARRRGEAEAVWQFVCQQLTERYQLGDGDTIDDAGVIRRGEKAP
jgi:hypothetical protein